MNRANDITEEICKQIQSANTCFYALIKFKSWLLTKKTKTRLYKTLVEPVLMYGSETWVLTQFDISRLSTFERKKLRKIYGPIKERGECRIRYNKELCQLYRSPDVITSVRISKLRCAGHVVRMSGEDILKRIRRRQIERPRLRWIDGV